MCRKKKYQNKIHDGKDDGHVDSITEDNVLFIGSVEQVNEINRKEWFTKLQINKNKI